MVTLDHRRPPSHPLVLPLVLLASIGAAGVASAQNLVANGGFESPVIAGATKGFLPGTVGGWTVSVVSNVPGLYKDGAFGLGNTVEGLQAWDMGLGGVGYGNSIARVLPTVAGQRYILTFAWGSEFDRGTYGRVMVGDLDLILLDEPFDQMATYSFWLQHSARFAFTASGNDLLTFTDLTDAGTAPGPDSLGGGLTLDDIAVHLDSDDDGLFDEEEMALGTHPLDADSDDDGLLDGTEIDMAQGGGCPDPLVADSDGDGLSDGDEADDAVGSAALTDPCSTDTDGDGIPDAIDPLPTDPTGTQDYLATDLRNLCEYVAGLELSLFQAPNANAAKGRRNAMCNQLTAAANATAEGGIQEAIDGLESLRDKLDELPSPKDWMMPGTAEIAGVAGWIAGDLQLLAYL